MENKVEVRFTVSEELFDCMARIAEHSEITVEELMRRAIKKHLRKSLAEAQS